MEKVFLISVQMNIHAFTTPGISVTSEAVNGSSHRKHLFKLTLVVSLLGIHQTPPGSVIYTSGGAENNNKYIKSQLFLLVKLKM